MARLKIEGFGGEVPRQSDTTLKESDATVANNVRLYSGELRTWAGPTLDYNPVNTDLKTIFRFKNTTTNAFRWLTWQTDVDVQRSSLADISDFRIYYTGDGIPKKTTYAMASSGGGPYPTASLYMGVPAPLTKPTTVAAAGASAAPDTRSYVYTYVSTFGSITEESAPSPPSDDLTITAAQSVNISAFAAVPAGSYNITARRIYRTQTGFDTDGAYVFVKEIPIATTTTNDNLLTTALGEAIETLGWDAPPDTLTGLTSMANGMMAGFVGNTVYFCEPYFHHAWPSEYNQSVPDQIVGLGAYGTTLVVLTVGQPYVMNGVHPEQISVDRVTMPEPCISKKSIAADQFGVLYASPNGIVAIGPNLREVITNALFRRRDWQEYGPATMVGDIYDGKYFGSYQSSLHGVQTMIISRDDYPACSFVEPQAADFFSDVQEGFLYYLDRLDNSIYQFDEDELNPYNYEWTSKRFVFPRSMSFSSLRLDISEAEIDANATYAMRLAEITTANQLITGPTFGEYNAYAFDAYVFNGSILQELPAPSETLTAVVELYGEKGVLQTALTISSFAPRRIEPFKTRELTIRLAGNLNTRSLILASGMSELHETSGT